LIYGHFKIVLASPHKRQIMVIVPVFQLLKIFLFNPIISNRDQSDFKKEVSMKLPEIRQAYDKNYRELLAVIQEMGGEGKISYHRANKTRLYQKLRKLQQTEHRLSNMEESLSANT
jgi:hypothetical protein